MAREGFTLESVASNFLPLKTFHHLFTLFFVLDTFLKNYVLNSCNTDSILVCPIAKISTKHLPVVDYCQFKLDSSLGSSCCSISLL